MLYFAYGSNLNKAAMLRRCPAAKPVGKFTLENARLVFRGVADVIREPGVECPGAIWRITDRCEQSLDRYEGYRREGDGMYRKVFLPIKGDRKGETRLMLYVMNSSGIMPPSQGYLATIAEGYRDFGLDESALAAAVKASWDDKEKTYPERRRRYRDGYPPLARKLPVTTTTGKNGVIKTKGTKR